MTAPMTAMTEARQLSPRVCMLLRTLRIAPPDWFAVNIDPSGLFVGTYMWWQLWTASGFTTKQTIPETAVACFPYNTIHSWSNPSAWQLLLRKCDTADVSLVCETASFHKNIVWPRLTAGMCAIGHYNMHMGFNRSQTLLLSPLSILAR